MTLFLAKRNSNPESVSDSRSLSRTGSTPLICHYTPLTFRRGSTPDRHSLNAAIFGGGLIEPGFSSSKTSLTFEPRTNGGPKLADFTEIDIPDGDDLDSEEDEEKTWCDRWSDFYDDYGLRHITPVLLLAVYSIVGAGMFLAIEKEADELHVRTVPIDVEKLQELTVARILAKPAQRTTLERELKNYTFRLSALTRSGELIYPRQMWTYVNALFYVMTLYTTIGYGNIYARTVSGKVATIVYCFFGIPLMLAILGDLGGLLTDALTKAWNWAMSTLKRVMPCGLSPKIKGARLVRLFCPCDEPPPDPDEDEEQCMPATAALLFTIFWLVFCSLITVVFEASFDFFEAFYFFFISLTTIGLGDVLPESTQYLIANFWAIIVGLIIVAMFINVIQAKIEDLFYRMMLLLEEEYMKLLEQEKNGEISPKQKRRMMRKLLSQQPFFAKHVLPKLVGREKQQEIHSFRHGATHEEPMFDFKMKTAPPAHIRSETEKRLVDKCQNSCQTEPIYHGSEPSLPSLPDLRCAQVEDQCKEDSPSLRTLTQYDNFDALPLQSTEDLQLDQADAHQPEFFKMLIPGITLDCQADYPLSEPEILLASPTQSMSIDLPSPTSTENTDMLAILETEPVSFHLPQDQPPIQLPVENIVIVKTEDSASQTEMTLTFDQQIMVDPKMFWKPQIGVQVCLGNFSQNRATEEIQTDISAVLCDLTIVPRRKRNSHESSNDVIEPVNVMVNVTQDAQCQTMSKTHQHVDAGVQSMSPVLYDVYNQFGAPLANLCSTQAQTAPIDNVSVANAECQAFFYDNDDLTDVYYDSSSESTSQYDSSTPLPMIEEENELDYDDQDFDPEYDPDWLENPEFQESGDSGNQDSVGPPWEDFDPLKPLTELDPDSEKVSPGYVTDSGVATDTDVADSAPRSVDSETQYDIVHHSNVSVQTAKHVKADKRQSALGRFFNKFNSEEVLAIDQATSMEDYVDYLRITKSLVDCESQTLDSYLRIAKGLTRLAHNRAASLKIMAAPVVRKNRMQIGDKLKRLESKGLKS